MKHIKHYFTKCIQTQLLKSNVLITTRMFFFVLWESFNFIQTFCYKKRVNHNLSLKFQVTFCLVRGAVAEWSKALLLSDKINENRKDPRFAPHMGKLKKEHWYSELDYLQGPISWGKSELLRKTASGEFFQNLNWFFSKCFLSWE